MRNPRGSTKRSLMEVSADESVLSWSVHLMTRQPKRRAQIGAVLLTVFALGLCFFHSLWLSLAPMLALLFSLSEFIFPVRYTLTPQSAAAKHGLTSLEIRWADVRHAYLTGDGIKLSPLQAKNSRFEPLRGVFLRFDDHNRDAVIAAVRSFRQRQLLDV
jgi:hypothetical protein